MITQDINGRWWHRGTRLGVVYSVVAFLIFGVTLTQDPDGPYAWLANFGPLLILVPLAAASHAFVAGQRDRLATDSRRGEGRGGTNPPAKR